MMFPIGRKKNCTRRNPRLAAALGMASACMMLVAALIERNDGEHWPVSVAIVAAIGLAGFAVLRLAMLNRDGR